MQLNLNNFLKTMLLVTKTIFDRNALQNRKLALLFLLFYINVSD